MPERTGLPLLTSSFHFSIYSISHVAVRVRRHVTRPVLEFVTLSPSLPPSLRLSARPPASSASALGAFQVSLGCLLGGGRCRGRSRGHLFSFSKESDAVSAEGGAEWPMAIHPPAPVVVHEGSGRPRCAVGRGRTSSFPLISCANIAFSS